MLTVGNRSLMLFQGLREHSGDHKAGGRGEVPRAEAEVLP